MNALGDPASTRLPLRLAVVKYPLGELPGAPDELIELFCEQAVGLDAGLFKIEFDRDLRCFDVLEFLDTWEEEEDRRGTRDRGIFEIGDDGLDPVLEVDEKDTLAPRINAAVYRLYALLQSSLKTACNTGRFPIWARQENLAKPLTVILGSLFSKYTVTDWFHGNAEANGGPRLFDIHDEPAPKEATLQNGSAEQRAIKAVAQALRVSPNLSKAEAKTALTKAGISIPPRAFNMRVWSKAREAAQLPTKAAPGRKPNRCA